MVPVFGRDCGTRPYAEGAAQSPLKVLLDVPKARDLRHPKAPERNRGPDALHRGPYAVSHLAGCQLNLKASAPAPTDW